MELLGKGVVGLYAVSDTNIVPDKPYIGRGIKQR